MLNRKDFLEVKDQSVSNTSFDVLIQLHEIVKRVREATMGFDNVYFISFRTNNFISYYSS